MHHLDPTKLNVPASHTDPLTSAIATSMAPIGPNGEPQCTPVWFEWDSGVIRLSLTTQRQKVRNLAECPLVALVFVDPDNMYRSMEIRGAVTSIVPNKDNAFVNHLALRYLGLDRYTFDAQGTRGWWSPSLQPMPPSGNSGPRRVDLVGAGEAPRRYSRGASA